MLTPRELKERYEQGQNISALLRAESHSGHNTPQIIETAYDLQAGSYVASMEDPSFVQHKKVYCEEVAKTILSLCASPLSVLEAGVGEATTFAGVLSNLPPGTKSYGFDLSWSRIAYARKWLEKNGLKATALCTGDLFNMPFADGSVDVVYTSHSIEPNGGSEEPILKELYRVARKYVVLLEPGYELAGEEARKRMESHGYCRDLVGTSEGLGYDVVLHKLFPYSANPLNPTALTIIRKAPRATEAPDSAVLACPRYKTPLVARDGGYFSVEGLVVYPTIGGIPCLRMENGIFASKYLDIMGDARP